TDTAAISGAPQTEGNRGQSGHQTAARTAAIRNGSPSTGRPAAWGMAFNTSFGPITTLATPAGSAGPPMPAPRGRVRFLFPIILSGDHSTWHPTVICTSAVETAAALFGVFARLMRKTQMSLPL